jgi:hypothetical protein
MAPKPKTPKQPKQTDEQRVAALVAKAKQDYPEYAMFFDEDFGGYSQEVRDLLIAAALDPNFTQELFVAKYKQTKYYTQVDKDIRNWDKTTPEARRELTDSKIDLIRANYGDLFTDDAQIEAVAQGAARQNLTGVRLKNFVFAQASTANKDKVAIGGTQQADTIKAIGDEYGYRVSDSEIESILTGKPEKNTNLTLTEQGLRERAKLAILGEMPHLKMQLDSGLTPAAMFKNYQSEAANLLEVDPSTISFSNPKWRSALSNRDGKGNIRQLSLSEWRQEIRTNPDYGYQFTKQANRDATDLALTLARAFGKQI